MNERKLQLEQLGKLILIVLCAMLYAWGGMEHKELRRFIAPVLAGAGALVFSRGDWRVLVMVPLLVGASCLGYGAEEMWLKLIKRCYVGFAFALAVSSYHLWLAVQEKNLKKEWIFTGLSCILILSFVLLGAFNPLQARAEETTLGLFIYALAIMGIQPRRRV